MITGGATEKSKGKKKTCVTGHFPAGEEHGRVGGKRKRMDAQEGRTVVPATTGIDDDARNVGTGHRRKRRRKGVGALTDS